MSEPTVEPDDDKPDEPEYTPPSAEEWERTRAALEKANAEAKNHRLKLREEQERQRAAAEKAGKPIDEKALREQLSGELAERYRAPAVRAAAKLALKDAGFQGVPSARILAMINAADCDVDDDGEVTGLDAQVREIKKDLPGLFQAVPVKPGKVDGAEPRAAVNGRKLSTAERIAAGVLAP